MCFKAAMKLTKCNYLLKNTSQHSVSPKKIFLIQFRFPALLLSFKKKKRLFRLEVQIYSDLFVISSCTLSLINWTVLRSDESHVSFSAPQFRYKTRVYKQTNLDEKALSKLSTKVFRLVSVEHCQCTVLISTRWHPFPSSSTPLRPVWRSSWITFRLEH